MNCMKMSLLKTFAFLLVLAVMLSVFSACGTDTEKDNPNTTTETTGGEEDTKEEETEYPLGIDRENNENEEIVILMPSTRTIEIAKESSSERVAQAMYERNLDAEEYLGILIEINDTQPGDWSNRTAYNDLIRTDVTNEKKLDIITAQISCSFMKCAQEGLFADLNQVTGFDFEAPWWIPDMTEEYGSNGKLYGAIGDLSMTMYSQLSVIYFNADLSKNYQLESPYDMVAANTWTLENMIANAKRVEETVDGNYDPLTNMMGVLSLHTANRNWLTSLDIDLVDRNADTGEVSVPKAPNEKLIDVFDLFYDTFENENEFYVHTKVAEQCQAFMNGTVLYCVTSLDSVQTFRGMEDDYGVVPMPKYNDKQEKFLTAVSQDSVMWFLPSTSENKELSAKLMEVLAYYGKKDVVPEYYEVSLGFTYARDPNTMEMLAIIRDGAIMRWESIFDGAFTPSIWNCLQMTDAFRHPVTGKETTYHGSNVSTWWAANQMTWSIGVAQLYSKLS